MMIEGMNMDNTKNAYFLIIAAVITWSLSGILVKSVEAGPLWISLIRSLGGGIFLLPYVFKERIYPAKYVLSGSIFMAIFILSLTITTRISSAAMAISMQYTAPMYVIAYSFYTNKKIEISKLIVFILIFIGILLNTFTTLENSNILAIVSGIITGLSFVFYSYSLQKVSHGNLLGIVSLINIGSAIIYAILLIFNHSAPPTSLKEIGIITISGIFISGISYALYGAGLRKVPMEKALILCLAEPILNPIWVYLGKGEIPHTYTIIGLFFILIGAVIDILFNKDKN